jgi:hypothetical protein
MKKQSMEFVYSDMKGDIPFNKIRLTNNEGIDSGIKPSDLLTHNWNVKFVASRKSRA